MVGLMNRMRTFDWGRVRHLVLSLDPARFDDGESGYKRVAEKRGIGELVRNLTRVDNIKLIDWVAIVEWYDNGFPHWHVLAEVAKRGRAGMIGHGAIKKHWPFGVYVWEQPIKSEGHWKHMLGYFGSHGYFGESKGHQSKLPEWAMNSDRHIKRWMGKRKGQRRLTRVTKMRSNESPSTGGG